MHPYMFTEPHHEPCSDQSKTCWQPLKSCLFNINFNIVLQSGFSLEFCQPKCYIRFIFPSMRAAPMYHNYLTLVKDVIVCCIHHSFQILSTGRVITIIIQHIVRIAIRLLTSPKYRVLMCFDISGHINVLLAIWLLVSTSYIDHLQAIRGRNQQPDNKIIAGSVLCVIGNIITHCECYTNEDGPCKHYRVLFRRFLKISPKRED